MLLIDILGIIFLLGLIGGAFLFGGAFIMLAMVWRLGIALTAAAILFGWILYRGGQKSKQL